jgi:hypothetical protein
MLKIPHNSPENSQMIYVLVSRKPFKKNFRFSLRGNQQHLKNKSSDRAIRKKIINEQGRIVGARELKVDP